MQVEQKTKKEFNPEEFLEKVRNAVMKKEWGAAILKQADTIKLEVVRVGSTDDLMIRVSGQKPGNALKIVTQTHLDNFLELVDAVATNEGGLRDKLLALRSVLREGSSGGAAMV
jgi:hypothetical protein